MLYETTLAQVELVNEHSKTSILRLLEKVWFALTKLTYIYKVPQVAVNKMYAGPEPPTVTYKVGIKYITGSPRKENFKLIMISTAATKKTLQSSLPLSVYFLAVLVTESTTFWKTGSAPKHILRNIL